MVDSTELISFSLYFSFFTELLFVDLSASLKDVHHCVSKGLQHLLTLIVPHFSAVNTPGPYGAESKLNFIPDIGV